MNDTAIDYAAVFQALPGMVALLTPDLVYRRRQRGRSCGWPGAPASSCSAATSSTSSPRTPTTRPRPACARPGRRCCGWWPPASATPWRCSATTSRTRAARALGGALLEPGQRARPRPGRAGGAARAPGGGGHRTHPRPRRHGQRTSRARVLEAELYTRARELQEVNERLRRAHAHEREVALALQEAMLPAPGAGRAPPGGRALPARGRRAERVRRLVRPGRPARRPHRGRRRRRRRPRPARRPASWASCAAPSAPPPGSPTAPPRPWRPSACTPAPSTAPSRPPRSRPSSTGTTTPSPTAAPATRRPRCVHPDGTVELPRPGHRPPARRPPRARPRARRPRTAFAEGATLVLYTDGLIERRARGHRRGPGPARRLPRPPPGRRPRDPRRRRCWPTCCPPPAPPTTRPWSSYACDGRGGRGLNGTVPAVAACPYTDTPHHAG